MSRSKTTGEVHRPVVPAAPVILARTRMARTPSASGRMTADERREHVLEAAMREFAISGFHGTSAEAIAGRAGISQPYLFRLLGTKRELFIAVVNRAFDQVLEAL